MFAMMVFSSFVSSITGAMTQLRVMTGAYDRMISFLRRYLQAHDISRDLSVRIIRRALTGWPPLSGNLALRAYAQVTQ